MLIVQMTFIKSYFAVSEGVCDVCMENESTADFFIKADRNRKAMQEPEYQMLEFSPPGRVIGSLTV